MGEGGLRSIAFSTAPGEMIFSVSSTTARQNNGYFSRILFCANPRAPSLWGDRYRPPEYVCRTAKPQLGL